MKEKSLTLMAGSLLVSLIVISTGCATRPGLPRTTGGLVVNTIEVQNLGEAERAQKLVDAQQEYRQALSTLSQFYLKRGMELKRLWADRELENLRTSVLFTFEGLADPILTPGPSISSSDEATLVEMVVASRRKFMDAVDELSLYYKGLGDAWRAAMVDSIRARFDEVRTYMYFADAEVPPADLTPDRVIADAEELYAKAVARHEDGWFWVFPTSTADQREALFMFLDLVRKYPSSRHIAESAYYIGKIYAEVFDEYYRAMLWYDRALSWDKNLDLPAMYESALVADKHLLLRNLAIERYRKVIKQSKIRRHVDYAKLRLQELGVKEDAE